VVEWVRALDFNSVAPGSNTALATGRSCFSVDQSRGNCMECTSKPCQRLRVHSFWTILAILIPV